MWYISYYKTIKIIVIIWFLSLIGFYNFTHAAWSISIWYARFVKGNCTEYVAKKRPDLFPSAHGQDRAFWWDAQYRLRNAQRKNIPTWKHAELWAIAVFAPRKWATARGHVAFVEEIYDDWTILVSDMNYNGNNKITYRIIPEQLAIGYIYDTTPQIQVRRPNITDINDVLEESNINWTSYIIYDIYLHWNHKNHIMQSQKTLSHTTTQEDQWWWTLYDYTIIPNWENTIENTHIENTIWDIYSDYDLLI